MDDSVPPRRSLSRWLLMLSPIIVFAALAAVFLIKLEEGGDPSIVPSALVGQPAPETELPALAGAGLPGVKNADFLGQVTLVNVWASWCVPCRQEHPALTQLSANKRIRIVGINYKDQPANALSFLAEMGNPYQAIGIDTRGRTAIDWGVYGVPETFLVGRDGTIRYKFVGPIGEDGLKTLLPEIEKALAAS